MAEYNRDIEYESNNVGYDSQYVEADGGGIKCKNYELCQAILPRWWFECKNSYLCTDCHMRFGTWGSQTGKGILDIIDEIECPICLEVESSITHPNCEHTLCISCFKRCYYGDMDRNNEPEFPYPDIENDYDEDPDNPIWDNYPLIKKYNEDWDDWDHKAEAKYDDEEYLRKCPLCRE